ncbi:hypothetical protein [Mixta calida]|uniref:hypothetical protein n=1 Tax=Mixta calida TaxID=665913 RepID=UPI0028A5C9C9|nr:hypothetical protein [Mixta calida]
MGAQQGDNGFQMLTQQAVHRYAFGRPDGYLCFTVNQLRREPGFHGGRNLRLKSYAQLRVKINAAPAPTP